MDMETIVVRLIGDPSSYNKMMREATDSVAKAKTIGEKAAAIDRIRTQGTKLLSQQSQQLNKLMNMGVISGKEYNRAMEALEKQVGQNLVQALNQPKKTWQDSAVSMASRMYMVQSAVSTGTQMMQERFHTTGEQMQHLGTLASLLPGPWGAAVSGILSVGGMLTDWFNRDFNRSAVAAREAFHGMATGALTFDQALTQLHVGALTEGLSRMVERTEAIRELRQTGGGIGGIAGRMFVQGAVGTQSQAIQQETNRIVNNLRTRETLLRRWDRDEGMRQVRTMVGIRLAQQQMIDMAREPRLALAQRTITRSLRGQQGFEESRVTAAILTRTLDILTSQGLRPTAAEMRHLQEQARQTAHALRAQYAELASDEAQVNLRNEIALLGLDADAQHRRRLEMAGVNAERLQNIHLSQIERRGGQAAIREREAYSGHAATLMHLHEQQDAMSGHFRLVVDTTAAQRELNDAIARGADADVIANARRHLALERVRLTEVAIAQLRGEMIRRNAPAETTFMQGIERASLLVQAGTGLRAYNDELTQLSETMLHAVEAQERLNAAQQPTAAAAFGSAEAMSRLEQQMERNRVRTVAEEAGLRTQRSLATQQRAAAFAGREQQIAEERFGPGGGAPPQITAPPGAEGENEQFEMVPADVAEAQERARRHQEEIQQFQQGAANREADSQNAFGVAQGIMSSGLQNMNSGLAPQQQAAIERLQQRIDARQFALNEGTGGAAGQRLLEEIQQMRNAIQEIRDRPVPGVGGL